MLAEALQPWKLKGAPRVYKPVGCLECRMTGYRGRAGLYELMLMTEAARALIHPVFDEEALRRQAVADGMHPLRAAGVMKVAEGVPRRSRKCCARRRSGRLRAADRCAPRHPGFVETTASGS